MVKVRELFRDTESTEFVIVTIPTVIYTDASPEKSSHLQTCVKSKSRVSSISRFINVCLKSPR